jgi:hypothetical protein
MEKPPILLPKLYFTPKEDLEPYKYTMNPEELGKYLFIPSANFNGAREGYVYKIGPSGIGYYLNHSPVKDAEFYSRLPPSLPVDPVKRTTIRHITPRKIPIENFYHELTFVDLPKLPDREPPTDTLAIYMGCHGIRVPGFQPNIKDVTISKFNYAGFCGTSYGYVSKNRSMSSAKNLVYGWEYLPRPTREEGLTSDFCNLTPHVGIDMEGTCTNFYVNPPNGWAHKIYTIETDPQSCVAVAYKNKVIDLLHCSLDELYAFIDIKDPTIMVDLHNFVIRDIPNKERMISTDQLFNLIKIMKQKGITKVHMFDNTCNIYEYSTTQPEGTGYGGTKRRKKRRKSRKKYIK